MSTGPSDPGWSSLSDADKLAWFQQQPPSAPPPPHQRHRRRLRIAVLCTLTLAVLVVGAWVVTGAVQRDHREQTKAAAKAAQRRAIATCRRQIGTFIEDLRDLDSSLDVGMNEADYGDAVREASTDANDVDESDLSAQCRSAYELASDALTTYAAIDSDWNDCIYGDGSCDADTDVDFSGWSDASDDIDKAYDAMRHGRTAGGSSAGTDS